MVDVKLTDSERARLTCMLREKNDAGIDRWLVELEEHFHNLQADRRNALRRLAHEKARYERYLVGLTERCQSLEKMEVLVLGTYDEVARTTGRAKSIKQIIPFDDLVVEIAVESRSRGKAIKKNKKPSPVADPEPEPEPGPEATPEPTTGGDDERPTSQ
jgi:hypothetical protein